MNKRRRRIQKARRRGEKASARFRRPRLRTIEFVRDLDTALAAADKLLASNTGHSIDEARVTHYECLMRDGAWVTEERS